jgi:hypothetical protein
MPRAHHIKAAKDYPAEGITKGSMYYKWKIKTGPRSGHVYRSNTPPKPQQLTTSSYKINVYGIQDSISELVHFSDVSGLEGAVEDIKSSIDDLISEVQGNLDNMPEGLQQGDTGQMLQERIDALQQWADEFDSLDFSWDEADEGDASAELDNGASEDQIREKLEEMNANRQDIKCGELINEIDGFTSPE